MPFACNLIVGSLVQCALAVVAAQAGDSPGASSTGGKSMTAQNRPKHTNRLIHATSPYLLQHAHNPVDWYEWGEEAFAAAKTGDKPIFLSIGYSACHWCHVMEHESFEMDDVAELLNASFISIKVDREERPDIDEIYMTYTQQRTGSGGWPMSVWLGSDGVPFFAGTYFPKTQFMGILTQIRDVWNTRRDDITADTESVRGFFAQWSTGPPPADAPITLQTVDETAARIATWFDSDTGGIPGNGNKFPPSMAMELMLRVYRRTKNADLLAGVEVTLDHMAYGGIYDHICGGICRYSTDPQWLVPHFEKMLYDQALVSAIYLDAHQTTGNPLYARVAADIFDYVIGDLRSPEGGFYSTRDADSEGKEGAYYIWTVEQIEELLGKKEAQLFCAYYDVTPTGNWFERMGHAPPGPKNILHVSKPPALFAKLHDITVEDLEQRLETWRKKLLAARAKRIAPALDDKILAAWNGLMIASLAKGARVLDEPKYATAAAAAAEFILTRMRKDGRLLRTHRGGESRLTAYLSDYAFMIEGLINLYEATFDPRWLDEAVALNETLTTYYYDEKNGAYFFTAADAQKLIARSKNPRDGAIPAGNSVQAMNLLRLAKFLNRDDYRKKAESIFRAFKPMVAGSPSAFERLLCAVDFYHDKAKEIAVIGPPESPETAALLRTVFGRYLPNKIVVHAPDLVEKPTIPLLKGKGLTNGKPTAYVCLNYTCRRPVTSAADLARQLDGTTPKER